ncbi:MAG: septum formation initiator family protein [Armatimonadota bacterium]
MSVNYAESRIPPKRRKVKPKFWKKRFVQLIFAVIISASAIFVVHSIALKLLEPYKLYNAEAKELENIKTELAQIKSENAALERKIKYLKTPEGAAAAARENGWVKQGEIILVLPPDLK